MTEPARASSGEETHVIGICSEPSCSVTNDLKWSAIVVSWIIFTLVLWQLVLYGEAVLTIIEERPVLNRLRRVSRRIGGWMAAKKAATTSGGSSNKASKKPSPKKQVVKAPASKMKDVKAKVKPTSKAPAAKPMSKAVVSAKTAVKTAAKAVVKPALQPAVKPISKAPAKPVNAGAKAEVKSMAVAKSAAVKSVPLKSAPEKAPAKAEKVAKKPPETDVVAELDSEFDTTDIVDADLEGAADLVAVESLDDDPSAVRRAAMSLKGPVEAEKVAQEKKKKKDDLKIDRSGDLEAQWASLKEKSKAIKPVPYKMTERYEARGPIQHKVLGWGYILTNQNDRLEVLFQDGIKFLISNYKA